MTTKEAKGCEGDEVIEELARALLEAQTKLAESQRTEQESEDWYNSLVHDLAALFKCDEYASAVILEATVLQAKLTATEADAAVMRKALMCARAELSNYRRHELGGRNDAAIEAIHECDAALATGAGKELLAEVERLRDQAHQTSAENVYQELLIGERDTARKAADELKDKNAKLREALKYYDTLPLDLPSVARSALEETK